MSTSASRTPVQSAGLVIGLGMAVLVAIFFHPMPDQPAIGTVAQQINPLLLMLPAMVMSSMAFLLPVGPPPNAVIFGRNRPRIAERVRGGAWVKLVVVLITLVVCLRLMPLIFGLDTGTFPVWAMPH